MSDAMSDTKIRLSLALLGGMLMGLTPAPVEAWFLGWVALVPLWWVVTIALQRRRFREVLAAAGLWGLGYHGSALFWITGVHPLTWMGVPWLASVAIAGFCWLFITICGVAANVVWAAGMVLWCRYKQVSVATRVLVGVALWIGIEWLLTAGPLCWTLLGYTQSPHNLVVLHLGRLSGPLTVSAAIVAVNATLAEAIQQRSRRLVGIAIALLVAVHFIGWGMYTRPLTELPEMAIRVGIIQGNIPNTIKLYPEGFRRAIEGYTSGYEALAKRGVEAVLTPETALPFYWVQQVANRSSLYRAILREQVPIWVGAFGSRGERLTNSLFSVNGDGETLDRFDKVKLVPLGEYIPFESVLGGLIDRLSPLDATLAPGTLDQTFETPWGRAIVGICYESAFPQRFRFQAAKGGQFILSSSNDAHYSETMPAQHHALDVMRAIEVDRAAVRATNTGYSAIVDPHGRTLWQSGLDTYELHDHTIYRRQTRTLYVRWGNWLTPVLFAVAALAWGRDFYRFR